MADLAAIGWATGPALPAGLFGATSARLPDGKAIVMGGNLLRSNSLVDKPHKQPYSSDRGASE